MGDLAPAPPQRTSDDVARTPEQSLPARKKAPRKPPPAPARNPEPQPDLVPAPEAGHQLDLLA